MRGTAATIHNGAVLWSRGIDSTNVFSGGVSSASGEDVSFYPGDLSNPGHGKVLQAAESNSLYVNCLPGCWGTPSNFLSDLGKSEFIHVADEYTGSKADNRYTAGRGGLINYPLPTSHTLTELDLLSIAHAGAQALGSGYGHVYHIFLPKGTDVCFAGSPVCYSPDNPATFVFCAFHGSVTFSDIGKVLLTVEPFQDVQACNVNPPSPNGSLIDSTANTLSHELFETITDPDGDGWWNRFSLPLFGAEIGDTCDQAFFHYDTVSLNGRRYEIQPEYSNRSHACTFKPADN